MPLWLREPANRQAVPCEEIGWAQASAALDPFAQLLDFLIGEGPDAIGIGHGLAVPAHLRHFIRPLPASLLPKAPCAVVGHLPGAAVRLPLPQENGQQGGIAAGTALNGACLQSQEKWLPRALPCAGGHALADESLSELPSQPFQVVWVQVRRVIACRGGGRARPSRFHARLTAPENPCRNKRNPVADWILW